MKKSIFLALLICASFSSFAQSDDDKTFKFGIGPSLSLPLGDLKDATSVGVGFELTGVYSLSDNIAAFAQLGIDVFKSADSFDGESSDNLLHIPLMVGARFTTNGFFAGAGIGYGLWTGGGGSSNGLLYSPQIGYDFGKIQILADYTGTSVTGGSLSYFGLKAFRTF
jgi:hypothetical protein